MATIPEDLALAVQYHQAGNLAQAEKLYRQILQADPAEANALHLLGMVAYQVDRSWYPTMRLFRQRTPGDWEEVFERMARELRVVS